MIEFILAVYATVGFVAFVPDAPIEQCQGADGIHWRFDSPSHNNIVIDRNNLSKTDSKIYVCTPELNLYVLVHELGHQYWYYWMTQEQRDTFIQLHNADKDRFNNNGYRYSSDSWFVTAYARTNTEEDFAELFVTILLGAKYVGKYSIGADSRTDGPKYNFVYNLIHNEF